MPLIPPVAVALPPGEVIEYEMKNFPAAAIERDIEVTYKGLMSDSYYPVGTSKCRFKEQIALGHKENFILIWHNLCGKYPKVRIMSVLYKVRVSLHGVYELRKEKPEPVETPTAEVTLECFVGGQPVDIEIVPNSFQKSKLMFTYNRKTATP